MNAYGHATTVVHDMTILPLASHACYTYPPVQRRGGKEEGDGYQAQEQDSWPAFRSVLRRTRETDATRQDTTRRENRRIMLAFTWNTRETGNTFSIVTDPPSSRLGQCM